jgi:hypothetical protein
MVSEEAFEVGLSFGGVPERVAVPFDAVTAFYDPAVQFGFQFEPMETEAAGDRSAAGTAGEQSPPPTRIVPPEPDKPEALPAPAATKPADGGTGGEVVRLDRFRKK